MERAEEKLELITKYFAEFSPRQLQQLQALDALYKDWNSKINVISRKDEESLYDKHVLHSLSIAAVFDFKAGMHVLDLGTGGGFPGIPLAVFFPEVQFHLVDSIGKKIKVVNAVAAGIGLNNVIAQHIRAEEIKNKKFDVVVSRAVAPLKDLWNWSQPLLRKNKREYLSELPVPNGLICLKGGDLSREISESGCKPRIMEIVEIFNEPVFTDKYILYLPYTK